jgi:urease accessory protein
MQSACMTATAATLHSEIFAANRARGRVELTAGVSGGLTRALRLREEGSLRVRFPASTGQAEAVMLNTGGGMAGGDRFEFDLRVTEGGHLVVTTAAAEKVYRALGPAAEIDVRVRVETGAALSWLPQETILFDRARLDRRFAIELAEDTTLVFAEALVLGRGAMGEAYTAGRLIDRWRVRRGGRLIYADGLRLEGDIAATLNSPASASGAAALATVLFVPGNEEVAAAVRGSAADFAGEVGASAWNGLAAVRLIARDGATLRHDLAIVMAAARCPLPRLWLN